MQTASLAQIKKELAHLSTEDLKGLVLSLAKFKKENKEFVAYRVFDAADTENYLLDLKQEICSSIIDFGHAKYFGHKKKLAAIVRDINKHAKFINDKAIHADLLIHFCESYNALESNYKSYGVVQNIYLRQLNKIRVLVKGMHEDLQYDYINALEALEQNYL